MQKIFKKVLTFGYFLDKICNKLFVFENKRISETNLSFSEYIEASSKNIIATEKKTAEARNKNKLPASIRNSILKLEEEIPILENEILALQKNLSMQTTDFHKMMDLEKDISSKSQILDEKTEKYFELLEIKESYNK